ncbi:LOW QUALITY PROTEIN: uncharacterized protein LOC112084360 [Eutrema salsugineum]|uniref:LOW QUALITY PROTEIN: uncharacterized protein LOC112084360 n=1 Tax=Eutrema salsugineum TaxID=72664 RepID=UPI000CED6BC5|nr:LOW QUALITY PROTEIN: uncharacterized protein LOC112084360 [Eutrema salsugineum]
MKLISKLVRKSFHKDRQKCPRKCESGSIERKVSRLQTTMPRGLDSRSLTVLAGPINLTVLVFFHTCMLVRVL